MPESPQLDPQLSCVQEKTISSDMLEFSLCERFIGANGEPGRHMMNVLDGVEVL